MIERRLKSKIVQCKLAISSVEFLHFDSYITRFTKSGNMCSFRCLGGLINC
jgi:hypothetical protein